MSAPQTMSLSPARAVRPANGAGHTAVSVSGRLVRSPFAGRAHESELKRWPLDQPHEYTSMTVFEQTCKAPILLSPGQRNQWLVQVLAAAREYVPALSLTVIRMGGPQGQLLRDLLDEAVFLIHEPRPATLRALGSNHPAVMEIWQDIRTDGIVEGENRVVITLFSAESAPGFLEFVRHAPPLAALELCSLAPVVQA